LFARIIETHLLIGPKALDRSLYNFAIERAAAIVDQVRAGAMESPGYTRRGLRASDLVKLEQLLCGSALADFLELWRELRHFDQPGVLP
jgi:hypothetical protein